MIAIFALPSVQSIQHAENSVTYQNQSVQTQILHKTLCSHTQFPPTKISITIALAEKFVEFSPRFVLSVFPENAPIRGSPFKHNT